MHVLPFRRAAVTSSSFTVVIAAFLGITRAGTPTAMELEGTSISTTALAPIEHIVPDPDRTQNLSAGADVHPVPQARRSTVTGMLQSHGDPVANHAIVSKDRVPTDDDSSEMVDSEPPSQRYFAGKLDPCKDLRDGFEHLVEKGKRHPQPTPANRVTPATKAVHGHGPQTLTGKLAAVCSPVLADVIFKTKCQASFSGISVSLANTPRRTHHAYEELRHALAHPRQKLRSRALVLFANSLDRIYDNRRSNGTEDTLDCISSGFLGTRTMLEKS